MAATVFSSTLVRAGGFMVSEAEGFRSRETITVLSGQNLVAGAVLGRVFSGGVGASAAAAGNTGNGAMGAITVTSAPPGVYELEIIEPAANAGTFQVAGPDGVIVGDGNVGAAFSGGGLGFTLADGSTDFVSGDRFLITVSGGVGKYKEYNPGNTDGSQFVAGILWDFCNASGGDQRAAGVVRDAEVNQGELTWFSGASGGQITAGIAGLAALGIIARPSVPA